MTATAEELEVEVAPEESIEVENDVDVIVPNPKAMTVGGIACHITPITVWKYIKGVNVLTAGVGAALPQIRFDTSSDEALQASILGLVMSAAPRAEAQLQDFVVAIVEADDEKQRNDLEAFIRNELGAEEFIDIIAAVVIQEKDNLPQLVKKLPTTFDMVRRQIQGS